MLGEDLDPDFLKAIEESTQQYEQEQIRAISRSRQAEEEVDLELLQAIAASEKEHEVQQQSRKRKAEEAVAAEDEDKMLAAAIALSKQESEKVSAAEAESSTSSSSSPQPISEVEAIRLQRLLTYVLKIPSVEVKACLEAIKMQKQWDSASLALEAYEKSTKEYSAPGLIAFMTAQPEVSPVETTVELKNDAARTLPSKRRK